MWVCWDDSGRRDAGRYMCGCGGMTVGGGMQVDTCVGVVG